jgi:hypothetical protein
MTASVIQEAKGLSEEAQAIKLAAAVAARHETEVAQTQADLHKSSAKLYRLAERSAVANFTKLQTAAKDALPGDKDAADAAASEAASKANTAAEDSAAAEAKYAAALAVAKDARLKAEAQDAYAHPTYKYGGDRNSRSRSPSVDMEQTEKNSMDCYVGECVVS